MNQNISNKINLLKKKLSIILVVSVIFMIINSCIPNSASTNENEFIIPSDLKEIGILLDSVYGEDQKYRQQIGEIEKQFGWDSKEMDSLKEKMINTDKKNTVIVSKILDNYGWLSTEQIGYYANQTLFLVIQHSDLETQEKYFPITKEAVEEGFFLARNLAMLEDRIELSNGRLQIYATQIGIDHKTGEKYVLPMIDPYNVNFRRESVGLGSIENYIEHYDLEWNLKDYEEKLPSMISKLESNKNY